MEELSMAVWNIRRFTWNTTIPYQHHFEPALAYIERRTPVPADIFALPEATKGGDNGGAALRRFANVLSELLPQGERYESFLATKQGRANPAALLLNTAKIEVQEWWEPDTPGTAIRREGWVKARVFGVETWIKSGHWQGGLGPAFFEQEANALSTYAHTPAIYLADCNQTSSWPGEVAVDWYSVCAERDQLYKLQQKGRPIGNLAKADSLAEVGWELNTNGVDWLRLIGFQDCGELAGNNTVTTNEEGSSLRIDRIFVTKKFPGSPIPGAYSVELPGNDAELALSDHRMVRDKWLVQV